MIKDFLVSITYENMKDPNRARAVIKHLHGFEFPEVEDPTDNKRVRDSVKWCQKHFSRKRMGKVLGTCSIPSIKNRPSFGFSGLKSLRSRTAGRGNTIESQSSWSFSSLLVSGISRRVLV